jgi:ATP-binding cassette subfamily F protein 3
MGLVSVSNLSLAFLGRALFRGVGFQMEPGDRIGIVGPNGSGKTTLFRLITGEISPDTGEISRTDAIRMGYLPQDISEAQSGPLLQSVVDSIPGRVRLREVMARTEGRLKNHLPEREQSRLAAELAEIHHQAALLDSEFPVHKAEKILSGLGFKEQDFQVPVSSLSGGWKMRAALASLLYQEPDLLLLDEPTNHLDVSSVHWLEGYLGDFKGALLLICHDREFLNRQISRVISLEPEGLRTYTGNYDDYVKAREEERKTLEARALNQEQRVKEARKFIERFRYKASKARQAQSKIKLLKKMELVKTHQRQKTIHFSFPQVPRSGREVLTIQGISKGFGTRVLYRDLHLRVLRGERVAILGPNGCGKTTLLRMIARELEPDEGLIHLGHGVSMSYYAQHHTEMLNPRNTIVEEVYDSVPHESVTFVRGVCGAFLFSGEDVDKTIGVLSGGERARVSLARILVKPGNLLVMDEPTNHLDIISSEILIDALSDFGGTLLFVSHNQSFINRLATKIWEITNGTVMEYPGTLEEYFSHLSLTQRSPGLLNQEDTERAERRTRSAACQILQGKKNRRKERAEKRRLIQETLKPVQDKLLRLEERVADLEKREKELGQLLADPGLFKDKSRSLPLLKEYGQVKEKLEELMLRWEHNQEKLEDFRKKFEIEEEGGFPSPEKPACKRTNKKSGKRRETA